MRNYYFAFYSVFLAVLYCSCDGLFDGLYDEIPESDNSEAVVAGDTIQGSLYLEANPWDEWFYIDFHAIREALTAARKGEEMDSSCFVFEPYKVPMSLTGEWDGQSRICTYRFRVLTGGGLEDNEFVSEVPCDPQPEPETWDLAIHRDNTRTHGGMALATAYHSLEELPESSALLLQQLSAMGKDTAFVADRITENEVYVDNSTLLSELIPCQAIELNPVLSGWLIMRMPPIPPAFEHNSCVFLLRMSDGTIAALRCSNYISSKNVKCCLTIEYRYPY